MSCQAAASSHREPVLVIGGTRGTGLLIAQLLRRQRAAVRVLARDPSRAIPLFGSTTEVIPGDITKIDTLFPAIEGTSHIVFTAGCRSGWPVREAQVEATEYHGVLNTLAAARKLGFSGRFLYMTSSGVTTPSFATFCLNLYKGNTLAWRRRAEDHIRASGLAYTIIRTGVLLNRFDGTRAIELTQQALPLSPRYRIGRSDVAEAFVAALDHPRAIRTTFEVVWGRGTGRKPWSELMEHLQPDAAMA
jgi:uncharacterized protein YbjT (DUF2867 family)